MARIISQNDYQDFEDEVIAEEANNNKSNWLIPLLVIPVFFVLGWLANDFARTNPSAQQLQQQYGMGGGPNDGSSASPFELSTPTPFPTPTSMILFPTPITLQEGLQNGSIQ